MALVFLPQPHKVEIGRGRFAIPRKGTIGICGRELAGVAGTARAIFKGYSIAVSVRSVPEAVTIRLRRGLRPGGYRLRIGPKGVLLEGESPAAAFWGLQTLAQAARQSPAGTLPLLTIDDWPDFPDRGIYYDLARGRVPKLQHLVALADGLSQFKINQLQPYIEHTFSFRGHPDIGKGASPLKPDDILALDEACRDRHVELVPSLASFGHLSPVLRLPKYRDLAEDWGVGKYVAPGAKMAPHLRGWTLSPANPTTYDFLDSLYAEFLPLFSSSRFNVCCDETWDLGLGQSHELCKRKGKGVVYLGHIRRLAELAGKYGKRIMFWGDIIRHYPDLIAKVPKDATVLDWMYNFDQPFAKIRDFREAGLPFYACPGTSGWASLFPRIHEAAANIAGFAAAGKRNGADGLLTTDWGDGGHYNFMEYSWHGYLYGAEQGWNTAADRKSFTARFCKLFLNVHDAGLAKAVDTLGDVTHMQFEGFYQSIWQHVFFAAPADKALHQPPAGMYFTRGGKISQKHMPLDAKVGRQAMERLAPAREAIAAAAKLPGADPHDVLGYWLFAADTILHAARKLAVLGPGGSNTPAARRRLKHDLTTLRKRFEKLWLARNRRSEIRKTLKRYDRAIRSL